MRNYKYVTPQRNFSKNKEYFKSMPLILQVCYNKYILVHR